MSEAIDAAWTNLGRVDDLLSFHTKTKHPAPGAPPSADLSIVLGSAALTYAAWEGYVEQVAVEVVMAMSNALQPDQVPQKVQNTLATTTGWALAGDGWKDLWVAHAKKVFLGDGVRDFGLNTAGPGQVRNLYSTAVGLDPFRNASWQHMSSDAARRRLSELVRIRGVIVHTAQPPELFTLRKTRNAKEFIRRLIGKVDDSIRAQAQELMGNAPW